MGEQKTPPMIYSSVNATTAVTASTTASIPAPV